MNLLIAAPLALLVLLGQPTRSGNAPGPDVLAIALAGYEHAIDCGEIEPGALLTLIDYTLPSTRPRLFVYDPATETVLQASLVAHGKNTGANRATRFGNEVGSRMSSLGFYVTEGTYQGKHGYSLRLRGLEPGFNDNAMERNIVIHGADYVSEEFVEQHGRLGRSWGCPALPDDIAEEIIDLIKDGTCIYIHGDDSTYLDNSDYTSD